MILAFTCPSSGYHLRAHTADCCRPHNQLVDKTSSQAFKHNLGDVWKQTVLLVEGSWSAQGHQVEFNSSFRWLPGCLKTV